MGGAEGDPTPAQVARAVRERLEVCRLFGWQVPLDRGRIAPRPPAAPPAGRALSSATTPRVAAPPPAGPASSKDRPAREAALEPIRLEVAACTRCGLCRTRTQTVFGVGDPAARLMFVGEAPGYDEDRQGEPFVGKAGQLLNDIIRAMGLRRDEVYIANVVKCHPPQNRAPDAAEAGACLEYLERQIEVVAPELIVVLGAVAAKALLGTAEGIQRLRGKFHAWRGIPVMPTFHPAYLLRKPEEKRKAWEDVQLVMARLGLQRPERRRA
ncbi:MAG: uracil-DNA glycosylase [Planctomycetes bacterium]|nr:uracil-DNA glycosylase [Planctomycetota bacterium]